MTGRALISDRSERNLSEKVRVCTDARLETRYPDTWPARVVVERSGRRQAALVSIPRGDTRNPIEWEDVLAKAAGYRTALTWIRKARPQDPIPQLLDALP